MRAPPRAPGPAGFVYLRHSLRSGGSGASVIRVWAPLSGQRARRLVSEWPDTRASLHGPVGAAWWSKSPQ